MAAPQSPSPDTVPAPLRSDLIKTEQNYLGRKFVILKNPLGLSYFRLPASHAEAAGYFDGKRSFRQIYTELRETNRYWRARPEEQGLQELMTLARQMAGSGLLRVQGGSAVARYRHIKNLKKSRQFEMSIGKILYFRKSLFDPDKLLERMLPWLGWIYSKPVMILTLVFTVVTFVAAMRHWDEITSRAANFFTFENLALTWVLFFGVKIVHEFGHGLTCKRFGGEVHEMGFMFILFTPYLFCNVSDSWLAAKSHRIYVTAAGIFVELILACVATWLWLWSQPGLFHQMCFNTMFLCSVSTVLFNANPLLKFDGYYIMTDLLEIPNLKQKSSIYVSEWAQRVLLGIKSAGSRLASFELNPLFGVYAVLSYIYGWLILYNISRFLFDALKPYGLEVLSRTYVILFLFISLALPFYRLIMSVKNTPQLRTQTISRARYVVLALLLAIAALFVIPWDDTIKRTVVVEHARKDPIGSAHPGFLVELAVNDGQYVQKGDLIGRLVNDDLLVELRDLELAKELSEVKYRAAVSSHLAEMHRLAPAHKKAAQETEEAIKGMREKIEKLTLYAPRDGVVRSWRLDDLKGQFFRPGRSIAEVGELSRYRAIIPLNEQQARRVAVGQKVTFRLFADPGRKFEGEVSALPVSPLDALTSPVLANLFGGDVPAEPTPDATPGVKPSVAHYEAEVAFDETGSELRPGMMGKARIVVAQTTLGLWIIDRILDWLDPGVRL